jgi:AcrR family transcriptional regulator
MPYPSRINATSVLDAARALLEERGPEGVTMRELARRLGVQAPSLYFHVESRDDVLLLLTRAGLEELGDQLEAAAAGDGGAARLHRLAGAYAGFASDNPRLFALVFGPCPAGQAPDPMAERASAALLTAVGSAVPPGEVLPLAQALWSLVHGYSTLSLAGQFRMGDPRAAMHAAIDLLVT